MGWDGIGWDGMGALAPAPAPVGWDGMGWDRMGGRKCRLLCIAVLVFVLVVVYVPLLILVQASLGWCTPFLGCHHGLVCLYQIKLNNVK